MTLPPYAALLGVTIDGDADGSPVLVMPFADAVIGRPGFVHGGALAGLLELAALAALDAALTTAGGGRAETITVTVEFMRGGLDRTTRAAGTVVRLGRRIATLSATAWQDDPAKPIAAARLTCQVTRT